MAIDLKPLWDFGKPEVSEQRFQAALTTARGDDALILKTQIARTHGLRGDFPQAREILDSLRDALRTAGPEARARHALEQGRSYVSATHQAAQIDAQARQSARAAFENALAIARASQLDGLAIDAIHMLAFVDTAPADQLKWGREALAVAEASSQPEAKAWEASMHNNIGLALHRLGRLDEALSHFRRALALREREANAAKLRVAHWMVGWTLRGLGRLDEALAIQSRLERECDAAQAPDRYVYEELELLHRALGNESQANDYATRKNSLPG